jgi:tetratricopeptide (TPR) repeat protein
MVLLVPSPGWAQADVDAYTLFYTETDPARKIPMGERFLADHKTSQYADPVFLTLIPLFEKASNWAKVIEWVGKLEQTIPGTTPGNKAAMYSKGMMAAVQANNPQKTIEFGEKVLTFVPGDVNTLMTLASTIPRALPNDEPGKKAALDKASQYGTRALAELAKLDAKSLGISEADWAAQKAATEGGIHYTLGEIAYTQKDYEKGIEELKSATKAMPKDGPSWYYLALCYDQMSNAAMKVYAEKVKEANDAIAAKNEKFVIDELQATSSALELEFRAKRDLTIETFAAAVAHGVTQARPRLESLYKTKNNNSLDGLDQLINSKKAM